MVYASIFDAICPAKGKGAGLVLPFCTITAMNLHLAEISQAVAPDAHAVLLMDQASWHTSDRLLVPTNITILLLPLRLPELNPVENIWQFMRENWLSTGCHVRGQHRLSLLLCLKPTGGSALENHVHRHACLGTSVLINEIWYQEAFGRSRGGFTSKIHACADGQRRPLDFVLTGGEASDYQAVDHKSR